MFNGEKYITLISSLPSSDRLFLAKLAPISKLRLSQRLKQLSEQDLRTLHQVELVLDWGMQDLTYSDRELISHAKKVYAGFESETLKRIVRDKMELRTCIAALRLRMQGENAPDNIRWGFGRWVHHINRNWNETHFALEKVFPWLPQAKSFLESKDAAGMERFILEHALKQLQRFTNQHYFDLEAVIIYVLKWNIVDRSTHYNIEAAKNRFTELVEQGLGDYAAPIFEN
jgi:hypothetical protein